MARDRPLRAAVVGTGRISEEHLRFLAGSDRSVLVGVCDLSPAVADFTASRFSLPRGHTDYQQMLHDVQPEVVHVLTPAATHPRLAREALVSGADVIAEKPIAPTLEAYLELQEVAQAHSRRLTEDHNYRFNRAFLALEALQASGVLGETREVQVEICLPRSAAGRYLDHNLRSPSHDLPGGFIHEFLTHLSYLALRLSPKGTPDSEVHCEWSKRWADSLSRWDDLRAHIHTGDFLTQLTFTMVGSDNSIRLSVVGTNGRAEVDLARPYVRVATPTGSQLSPYVQQAREGWQLMRSSVTAVKDKMLGRSGYEGIHNFLNLTYAALQQHESLPVGHDDIASSLSLIDKLVSAGAET